MVQWSMVTVALARIRTAPDWFCRPLVIVRLLISTVMFGVTVSGRLSTSGLMSKIRSRALPLMVVPAGSPTMVIDDRMSRSPLAAS